MQWVLMQADIDSCHIPGKANQAVERLSRDPEDGFGTAKMLY